MSRSAPHPRSKKTPRGGRKMARMILQMSLWVALLAIQVRQNDVSVLRPGVRGAGGDLPSGERHDGNWFGLSYRLSKVVIVA